jgi:homoserine dehydrogenase
VSKAPKSGRRAINVGLLGIGTVGSGTFAVLARNREEISRRAGCAITMKMVADKDLERARRLVGKNAVVTGDANEVVSHPEERRDGCVRGGGGRRHSDHQVAA